MVGEGIMVAPVTNPKVSKIPVYFPSYSRWYNLHSLKEIKKKGEGASDLISSIHMIDVDLIKPIPAYLRGGYMIFKSFVGESIELKTTS